MARQLTRLNDKGVRAILTGGGVAAYLEQWGGRVNGRAGGAGAERAPDAPGGGRVAPRARVRVYGSLRREADTGYLSAALQGDSGLVAYTNRFGNTKYVSQAQSDNWSRMKGR